MTKYGSKKSLRIYHVLVLLSFASLSLRCDWKFLLISMQHLFVLLATNSQNYTTNYECYTAII